jgi:DNA-binding Lrp family transcriptional regulator
MAIKAYVLIEAAVGKTESVAVSLAEKPGISTADVTLGPYDVIASVRAADAEAIAKMVLNEIGILDGVTHTTTCLVVSRGSQEA